MTTLDALLTAQNPLAVGYKTAAETGNAPLAAALAEQLQAANPGIVLPTFVAVPTVVSSTDLIITSDQAGVDDAAVT